MFGETCGGAPPATTTCESVTLLQAVGFFDRACAYAKAAMTKTTSVLSTLHQGIYPNKPAPSDLDVLVAPFNPGSSIMADYAHTQTVCSSELTFQLLLGHQIAGDFDKVTGEFPKKSDGKNAWSL